MSTTRTPHLTARTFLVHGLLAGLLGGVLAFAAASSKTDQRRIAELVEAHGAPAFAAEWLRHRGCAWAVELLPEPQPDPLAGNREDTGQLPLALKDMIP